MYQLYERQKLNQHGHMAAWTAFERWRFLRRVVQSSTWTSWIGEWVPQLKRNEDFRYKLDTDPDVKLEGPKESLSWSQWTRLTIFQTRTASDQETAEETVLNSTNFVSVVASELELLKKEVLKTQNITITSAIVAKPEWVFNNLDKLVDRAFLKADIELFDKKPRSEAAMAVAIRAGKKNSLVLEQCGYDFRLSKQGGSMGQPELGWAWIPGHLAGEMLIGFQAPPDASMESLNGATTRLVAEVARTRNILKYACGAKPESLLEQEGTINIPDFGVPGFTFTQPLLGANISRVEGEYVKEVKEAVETMLLDHGEIYTYYKERGLFGNIEDDHDMLRTAIYELAKTVPHPRAAEGGSWWHVLDSVLVLAEFPEADLIRRGACEAIEGIPGVGCKDIFGKAFAVYDLAARGAAIRASDYVASWEEEEQWRKESEQEDLEREEWEREHEEL